MEWVLFALGILSVPFTINVVRPVTRPPLAAIISFFGGWLTADLPFHHLAWQIPSTALLVSSGALRNWPGWVGLSTLCAFWLVMGWSILQSARSRTVLRHALQSNLEMGAAHPVSAPIPKGRLALFFPRLPAHQVERIRDIPYATPKRKGWLLDIYREKNAKTVSPSNALRPVLLEVHGGGWVLGDKREQGLPLIYHMAESGWVCVSANYRLSPAATFPDPLIDLKRALAWIRTHIKQYGGDPDFVAVTGGSAGGHLASLLALTPNDPRYQPGFQTVDTSVRGCFSAYGVYDLYDQDGLWPHDGFAKLMELQVLKARRSEASALYEEASPIFRITENAPPFFVVHGTHDTLVPVAGARAFVERLRTVSKAPVLYAELPGAQHAFDVFYCMRSLIVVQAAARFLQALKQRHPPAAEKK
jgi:acetyl esterase/lipase